MIYLYCGTNQAESRNNFIAKKQYFIQNNNLIIDLDQNNLSELSQWLTDAQGLFQQNKVFFAENLKLDKANISILKAFDNQSIDLYLWVGDIELRSVKTKFKTIKIFESKLPYNIFKFLDSLFPGNFQTSIKLLKELQNLTDYNIVLYMTQKSAKQLLLASDNIYDPKLASWQTGKLKFQASKWQKDKLISFYFNLTKLEHQIKSGKTPYSIHQGLNILFAYYLI